MVTAIAPAAFIPPGRGHTFFNASLRHLPATPVNVLATQAVMGGMLLGILMLGELPGPSALAGVVMALASVFLVHR